MAFRAGAPGQEAQACGGVGHRGEKAPTFPPAQVTRAATLPHPPMASCCPRARWGTLLSLQHCGLPHVAMRRPRVGWSLLGQGFVRVAL